jgi:hypothetical protein
MPIYRVDGKEPRFFEARDLRVAKLMTGKGEELREWRHCLAPQHAGFPVAGYSQAELRSAEAVAVHDSVPYCARCLEHAALQLEDRVERIERAMAELRADFDRHGEVVD